MKYSPLISQLIDALQVLPSVGPKSAQRMVLHLLERDREKGILLAQAIEDAMVKVGKCQSCRLLSEKPICDICASPKRDTSLLCIVETPSDLFAIESTNEYSGLYFVLGAAISPLDGIGPKDIGFDLLQTKIDEGDFKEIVIATSTTVEGEATAFYISDNLRRSEDVTVSRIAHGVPLGGELEYVDGGTIARAFSARAPIEV